MESEKSKFNHTLAFVYNSRLFSDNLKDYFLLLRPNLRPITR